MGITKIFSKMLLKCTLIRPKRVGEQSKLGNGMTCLVAVDILFYVPIKRKVLKVEPVMEIVLLDGFKIVIFVTSCSQIQNHIRNHWKIVKRNQLRLE